VYGSGEGSEGSGLGMRLDVFGKRDLAGIDEEAKDHHGAFPGIRVQGAGFGRDQG